MRGPRCGCLFMEEHSVVAILGISDVEDDVEVTQAFFKTSRGYTGRQLAEYTADMVWVFCIYGNRGGHA